MDELLKEGVSTKVPWNSPTVDFMYQRDKNVYIADRAGIALFIASHRGNLNLVKGLIQHGNFIYIRIIGFLKLNLFFIN